MKTREFSSILQSGPRGMRRSAGGFTLVELVTVILILGVLAAVALPRYADLTSKARIAKVQHLVGALKAAAALVKANCMAVPGCASSGDTTFVMDGRAVRVNYGYPEAGDSIGNNQIDTTLDTTGFVASLVDNLTTKFSVGDAPDPANCAVTYQQALPATLTPTITVTISGC